jgi:hypothetical protein
MSGDASFRKVFLATLATLFAVAAITYGSLWMYTVRRARPTVELGFNNQHDPQYDERTHCQAVEDVVEGSPAERAGLRVGDRITGVNGQALLTDIGSDQAYLHGRPGDVVEITVERAGEPKPLVLHGVFRAAPLASASEGLAKSSAQQITGSFPIPFVLVAFAVLLLRLEEPNAWLLAMLFCAFVATPGFHNSGISPALSAFVLVFRAVFARDAVSPFLSILCSFPGAIASGSAPPVVEVGGASVGNLYRHSRLADRRSNLSRSGRPPGR